jgi:hypothetical protein
VAFTLFDLQLLSTDRLSANLVSGNGFLFVLSDLLDCGAGHQSLIPRVIVGIVLLDFDFARSVAKDPSNHDIPSQE